jgi:hypothetical protein
MLTLVAIAGCERKAAAPAAVATAGLSGIR